MKLRLVLAYLIVLVASHVAIAFHHTDAPSPEVRLATVRNVNSQGTLDGTVRLAYRDSAPDSSSTPVILVHGSPGTGAIFSKLTPELTPRFRVIAPDLPGFGDSTREIPDYSFRAHARYLLELMDRLHIAKAQLVGFSMGGGVVLSMEDLAPERVASIVMLSAIGIQKHELTGSHRANHVLHGVQLALLRILHELVPHFGLLDRVGLNVQYARNFFDSDQRPLEAVLRKYRGPMLIIHGSHDSNVPLAAALEHHRLVPQSEIVILDQNHFMTFMNPQVFADPLRKFLTMEAAD